MNTVLKVGLVRDLSVIVIRTVQYSTEYTSNCADDWEQVVDWLRVATTHKFSRFTLTTLLVYLGVLVRL